MIGPSRGNVLLYVTTSGILCDLFFSLVWRRLFLCMEVVLWYASCVIDSG